MKAKEDTRKACNSYKYFSFRYYKVKYTFLVALGCGECVMRKFTEEERAKLPLGFVCDKWTRKTCDETDISEIKNELGDITARLILIIKTLSN